MEHAEVARRQIVLERQLVVEIAFIEPVAFGDVFLVVERLEGEGSFLRLRGTQRGSR